MTSNFTKATGVVVPLEELLSSPEGASNVITKTGVDVQTYLDSIAYSLTEAGLALDGSITGSNVAGVNVGDWTKYPQGNMAGLDIGVQLKLDKATNTLWLRSLSLKGSGPPMQAEYYLEALNTNVVSVTPLFSSDPVVYDDDFLPDPEKPNTWGPKGIYLSHEVGNTDRKEYQLTLTRLDENTLLRLFVVNVDASGEVTPFVSTGDRVLLAHPNLPLNVIFNPTDSSNIDVKWDSISGDNKPEDNATKGATWGVDIFGNNLPASGATVNHTFVQSTIPTENVGDGDIWIHTGEGNKLYVYELGTGWTPRQDNEIAEAILLAQQSTAAADGKINTFYQASPPTAEDVSEGDLWFDTDDGNSIHIYEQGVWVNAQDEALANALDNATTALAKVDGKVTTYFTAYDPYLANIMTEGDLWYDGENKALKRWNSTVVQWDIVSNFTTLTSQLEDDDRLGSTADWQQIFGAGKPEDGATKNHIFAQNDIPAPSLYNLSIGDIWIDTDDSNTLHIWDGNYWVSRRDSELDEALSTVAGIEAALDGKVTVFYQVDPPSGQGENDGDIWFDTNDGNKIYILESSVWVNRQDSAIAEALNDAATAQATADGKITTYFTETEPVSNLSVGDLWYQDSTKLLRRWNTVSWEPVSNSYDNTNQLVDGAGLGQTADWDQVTGANKPEDNANVNNTFTGPTAPTDPPYDLREGDLWINTSNGNSIYAWEDPGSGYQWVSRQDVDVLTARTDIDGLLASSLTSLLDNADTHQRVIAVEQTVLDIQEDNTLASQVSALSTQVDANEATIIQHTTSLNGIRGEWGVNIDVNGNIAGINLISELVDNTVGVISDFSIVADKFRIVKPGASPGTPLQPFTVDTSTNTVAIQGNLIVTGSVGTTAIANSAITSALIGAGAVGTLEIATGAVSNLELADDAVSSSKILAAAITASKILDGAVTATKIGENAVTSFQLADDAVNANNIVAGAIAGTHIGTGAITSTNIAANTISANNIALGTIDATRIANNAITTAKIAADAVTSAQLAASSVGSTQLAAGSVTAGAITAGAITTAKIATGAITAGTIAAGTITSTQIAAGGITATSIASNAITADKLSANSVTAAKILAGTITSNEIAANTIAANNIAADAITADKIAAGAITAAKINVASLDAVAATMGVVTGGRFQTGTAGFRVILSNDLIDADDGTTDLPLWMGNSATPAKSNATFYIDEFGNAYFGGTIVIGTGQVVGSNIATDAIDTTHLSDGAVTADIIAAGTITSANIAAGAIVANNIAAGAITAVEIAAGAITANEIAAGAVTATQLNTNSINATHIQADVINNTHIALGGVDSSSIANNAINSDHISAGSVTSTAIAIDAVNGVHIATNAIDGGHIQAGVITGNLIAASTIVAANLAANSVTAAKIVSGTITATQIAAGAITTAKLAADAVTADKIAANTITATEIAAGAVTADKINVTDLSAVAASIQDSVTVGTNDRLLLDGTNGRIQITDASAQLRVNLGALPDSEYGLELYNSAGLKYLDASGRGLFAVDTTIDQGDGVTYRNIARGLETGTGRDGDAITFSEAWSSIPIIRFSAVGLTYSPSLTGSQVQELKAINVSTTGFTISAKLKELAGAVTQFTDTTTGSGGGMDAFVYKSQTSDAFDDTYTLQYDVTISNHYEGESGTWLGGFGQVNFYVNKGAGWVQVGSKNFGGSTTGPNKVYSNQTKVIVSDGVNNPGGAEFGVTISSGGLTPNSISIDNVKYTTAAEPVEVTATPTGAPDVTFFVLGGE